MDMEICAVDAVVLISFYEHGLGKWSLMSRSFDIRHEKLALALKPPEPSSLA